MEGGLTLSEIFKVIFKRIWWVLGATAVCLAVAVLVSQLWYNKAEQYYSLSYEIVYPDSASGKYPDGSDLFAEESVSVKTLTDIKNGVYTPDSPDKFKGIDVNGMHFDDGISAAEKVVKSEDGNIKRLYTLTAKAKYFSSKSQANDFLRTVAEYPVNRVNRIMSTKKYDLYLDVYDNAPSYDEAINALLKQKNFLEQEYSKLQNYGEVAQAGIASLHNILTPSQQEELKAHILAERYVLDAETFKSEAGTRIASLKRLIDENEKILASLREAKRGENAALTDNTGTAAYIKTLSVNACASLYEGSTIVTDPYDAEIARLTVENGEMQNSIDNINATLSAIEKYTDEGTAEYAAKQAFDARFQAIRTQLADAATTLKTVSVSVYADNSRVVYSSNKLATQGGVHWLASAFLGAVIGLIISSLVIGIIDVPKYKRAKLAAADKDGGTVEAEPDGAQAEAESEEEK